MQVQADLDEETAAEYARGPKAKQLPQQLEGKMRWILVQMNDLGVSGSAFCTVFCSEKDGNGARPRILQEMKVFTLPVKI